MPLTKIQRAAQIGSRLRRARETLGFSQQHVAGKLGIGRPRYSDIENGKRTIPLEVLEKFCDFYGRPISYFLKRESVLENGFGVLFRKSAKAQDLPSVVTEFEGLCERMHDIEKLAEVRVRPPVPDDLQYEKNKLRWWGQHYAEQERKKLDLGNAPVKDLGQILEEKCGVRIFYLPISDKAGVFGMSTYDAKLGACILINANPSRGNQLFSLAHEYAHILFHKKRLGVVSYGKDYRKEDERLANHFSSAFLMPASAVETIYGMRLSKKGDVPAEDVVYTAHYFGVSFQAMVYRLNSLKMVSDQRRDNLLAETWVGDIRESMGIAEPQRGRSKFPQIYIHLCIKAYQKGRITTAKLAEFLEIPLFEAMELGHKIRGETKDESSDSVSR